MRINLNKLCKQFFLSEIEQSFWMKTSVDYVMYMNACYTNIERVSIHAVTISECVRQLAGFEPEQIIVSRGV